MAPKDTFAELFTLKPMTQRTGMHIFTPQLSIVESGDSKQWRLEGFDELQDNVALTAASQQIRYEYSKAS